MYVKRTYRKRRPVKKARRVLRKSSGARKSIVKIVKSVISRQAENKAWFDYGANQSIDCASATTFINKALLPVISQGTGKSNRIGNEIRVKSAFIRGHVNLLPYNSITNSQPLPCYVKMWILSCKSINAASLSSTNISSSFFDIVNSNIGPQGNMLDMSFTHNKELWNVHATKIVKLGAATASSTGPVSVTSYYDNSPMAAPFYFNYGKYLKTLKFDDAGTSITNRNMFLAFQVVPANGASAGGQIMAEFHYTTRVEYEDM